MQRPKTLLTAPALALKLVFLMVCAWALLPLSACGEENGAAGNDCVAGKACVCEGGDCDFNCGGTATGCAMECSGGATCSLSCPGGSCSLKCTDAASCNLDCPGNNCSLECTGTDSCVLEGCSSACATSCGGADTCDSSCSPAQGCGTTP